MAAMVFPSLRAALVVSGLLVGALAQGGPADRKGAAAAAGAQDPSKLAERVTQALDDARPALLAHLEETAARPGRAGELALVLLAAVHDGVDPKDKRFAAAVEKLAAAAAEGTYDLALRLMVMEAYPDFPDRARIAAADARLLLACRGRNGLFGYNPGPGRWDLSNTQYGALGLRAAAALGVPIERSVWNKIASAIGDEQDTYGGWNYEQGSGSAYASMTAAGIAVMAICQQQLAGSGDEPKWIDQRLARGWQWLARNEQAIGDPRVRSSYYFHYGLERAAILCDVQKVGAIDWYAVGAMMLCDEQDTGGGWNSGVDHGGGSHLTKGRGEMVPTAFAILFLRRKFQKVAGPITPRVVVFANLGPSSKAEDVDACAKGLIARGKAALPEVLHHLRSDVRTQRQAAAAALRGLAGQDFGYDPAQDPLHSRDQIHAAELWYLRNR
jgi:hypothetical protein